MIYSDSELQRWWQSLSNMRRREILETMVEKAWSESAQKFAESLKRQWDSGAALSPKQIAAAKKWDH